ncbi:transcriptional repressor [Mortierella claussenii]|nr:transcriptional repressor [Mortierella claussenii]
MASHLLFLDNSGHLARHNRIHTGERNFACLMPGCPSKFSRQDNMMQHYRTHISPKSRRGTAKKDGVPLGTFVNSSQESLSHGGREQSPAMSYYGAEYEQQHSHVAKIGGSRQGSRQNSPPRFNPLDRGGSVEYSGRHPSDSQGSGGSLRHKKSGIIQTHQHHTPLPHFNVHAMSRTQQQVQTEGQTPQPQGTLPSPLTPTISQIPTYHQHHHHQPAYVTPTNYGSGARQEDAYLLHRHAVDMSRSPSNRYRNDAPLASPTSPMTQDVERMEGVAPMLEQDRLHYRSSQLHHQHRQQQHHSHPSHAGQHQSGYQLPPLSSHGQERKMHENRSLGSHLCAAMPPSPQSTPHTPTKYRFDPIHDCLHQEKHHQHHQTQSQQHQQQHQQQDGHEMHYEAQSRFTSSHYQGGAAPEDEEMSSTTRSSIMSSASSMTSISSVSSASMPTRSQNQDSLRKQDPGEEMSGLAHLAQIVTTYG